MKKEDMSFIDELLTNVVFSHFDDHDDQGLTRNEREKLLSILDGIARHETPRSSFKVRDSFFKALLVLAFTKDAYILRYQDVRQDSLKDSYENALGLLKEMVHGDIFPDFPFS